jgi:hypothetical protein
MLIVMRHILVDNVQHHKLLCNPAARYNGEDFARSMAGRLAAVFDFAKRRDSEAFHMFSACAVNVFVPLNRTVIRPDLVARMFVLVSDMVSSKMRAPTLVLDSTSRLVD